MTSLETKALGRAEELINEAGSNLYEHHWPKALKDLAESTPGLKFQLTELFNKTKNILDDAKGWINAATKSE